MKVDCGPLAQLPEGGMRRVEVEGREPITVYRVDGELYATDDNCTHKWASLAAGTLSGHRVLCPWHDGAFDIRSGAAVAPPCFAPLRTYPARAETGRVLVEVDDG